MRRRWLALMAVALSALGYVGLAATGASPASAAAVSSCKPTAAHPIPVVLVHGTFESSSQWKTFEPALTAKGYCVSAVDYNSTQDIKTSAAALSTYVNQVLKATGAAKVDLVGHSQGGMMPRYYLKNLGGAAKVDKMIAIAPSNYGTTLDGLATLAGAGGGLLGPIVSLICTSCQQQIQGSAFLKALNSPTDVVPGVTYTVIESSKDEVVTPYTNAFLKGAGATNELVQKFCPADASGHIALANTDQNAWQLVFNALDPAHSQPVSCVPATNGT